MMLLYTPASVNSPGVVRGTYFASTNATERRVRAEARGQCRTNDGPHLRLVRRHRQRPAAGALALCARGVEDADRDVRLPGPEAGVHERM